MFTAGIVGFAFTELHRLSKRAATIYESAAARVSQNKDKYPSGLLAQYEIQLERLKSGTGCELISVPGLMSGPSKLHFSSSFFMIPMNPRLVDTPQKGKKYYTMLAAINHGFTRGTIVS